MNRLVRIALTLFVSSSILIVLVLKRLERAKEIAADADDSLTAFAENEIQMAYAGMGICVVMLVGGITLLITAWVRSRKSSHG